MNTNQVVKFNNQQIPVFFHNNKPYVAMKPICENIGLDWNGQFQRIKRDEVLNSTMCVIHMVAQDGKNREVVALPIGYLNGWLFGIDVNRVKPEIKSTLIKYKLECYDVLYNHFMPKVAEVHPNTITLEQQQAIKDAVLRKAERDKRTYQSVYREFYNTFDIPRYQELPLSKFDEALDWLNDGFVAHKPNPLAIMEKELYQLCLNALSSNKDQIQLLHNINISFHSDTISNNIALLKNENRKILEFSRAHNLTSQANTPLVSNAGFVSFYHGGGFSMDRNYFLTNSIA